MARRIEPEAAWTAYADAHRALRDWLDALPPEAWDQPSVLPEWTVAELAAHMIRVNDAFTGVRPEAGMTPHTVLEYVSSYIPNATNIAAMTRDLSAQNDHQPEKLLSRLDERYEAAASYIRQLGPRDQVVATRRLPLRLSDFIVTRIIEVVVHADDFVRSVPSADPLVIPRNAEALTIRALADALAERAPGRTVELRIPPFAAVQCVDGPQHTRGTPPNVVEMAPVVWMRLAAGRTTWAEETAAGTVFASGGRADLSEWLPLL